MRRKGGGRGGLCGSKNKNSVMKDDNYPERSAGFRKEL